MSFSFWVRLYFWVLFFFRIVFIFKAILFLFGHIPFCVHPHFWGCPNCSRSYSYWDCFHFWSFFHFWCPLHFWGFHKNWATKDVFFVTTLFCVYPMLQIVYQIIVIVVCIPIISIPDTGDILTIVKECVQCCTGWSLLYSPTVHYIPFCSCSEYNI